ncbi:response regulator transcription factor [Prolixibacteraceae bacterium JC049]|nr:response regulator transcription factor [Prolixibacteraceae bacterium JC049]
MSDYRIVVADQSEIIRKGLIQILKHLPFRFQTIEVSDATHIQDKVNHYEPQLVIVNPQFIQNMASVNLKETFHDASEIKFAGLVAGYADKNMTNQFDTIIYINDTQTEITKQVEELLIGSGDNNSIADKEVILSDREIDVLKLLVKGHSNKEISDQLFISTHTVISHRKNITRKVGIKSVAGLTVFALINNYVRMDDF